MNKKIYFFEVKPDEQNHVLKKYPNALLFEEPFSKDLIEKVSDAHILCGMVHSDFSAENLSPLKNLELLVTRSVGYNHVDLKYCDEHNISVCNVPEYGSYVIAEHVFALLLSSVRNILTSEEHTSHGNFDENGLCGIALKGKTLGIIGVGKIGAHVARIASKGFLMKVIAYDVHPDSALAEKYEFEYLDSVDEIYEQADFISLHVPLFPSTEHMINDKSIAKMRDGVTLINTSRGALINTHDLVKAIKAGKFAHVALDVVEHENNLSQASELLHLSKVVITPHIAYYTRESVGEMYRVGLLSISEYINGKKLSYQVFGD